MSEHDDDQEQPKTITIPADVEYDDELIHGILYHEQREALRQSTGDTGKDRRARAMVAANIADDRYHAGSTAAKAAVFILIEHGWEAVKWFIDDLEHHEH